MFGFLVTLLVLEFVSLSFSLSFEFARFSFAHLVQTYSRSFKFAQEIFAVLHFTLFIKTIINQRMYNISVFMNEYYNLC